MLQFITRLLLIGFVVLAFSYCGKNSSSDDALLYGKWATEGSPYDTMYFFKRAGRSLVYYRFSFNPSMATYTESEYRFRDGKLDIGYTNQSGGTSFFTYSTFKWVQVGKKFELNGNQRFPILSSIQPNYIYTKIN